MNRKKSTAFWELISPKKICWSTCRKVELAYDETTNEIVAPTFRHDIFRTADLAEEVARFYGYDNIPTTLPSGEATTGKLPFKLRIEEVARDMAEYCGFSQGYCYSFRKPESI